LQVILVKWWVSRTALLFVMTSTNLESAAYL